MEELDALAIVNHFRDNSLSANECAALIGQYAYRYNEEIRKDRDYWKHLAEAFHDAVHQHVDNHKADPVAPNPVEYARILQNMVEEAEENLASVAEKMRGYENLEHLDERRAELKEAQSLVATLDPEHYKAPV
jgi:DNA repair exonuclease SbcCD ATPase subunit